MQSHSAPLVVLAEILDALGNALAQRDLEQAQFSYTAMMARSKKLEAGLALIREGRGELPLFAAFVGGGARGRSSWRRQRSSSMRPSG